MRRGRAWRGRRADRSDGLNTGAPVGLDATARRWSSGRTLASQANSPGSIPGRRTSPRCSARTGRTAAPTRPALVEEGPQQTSGVRERLLPGRPAGQPPGGGWRRSRTPLRAVGPRRTRSRRRRPGSAVRRQVSADSSNGSRSSGGSRSIRRSSEPDSPAPSSGSARPSKPGVSFASSRATRRRRGSPGRRAGRRRTGGSRAPGGIGARTRRYRPSASRRTAPEPLEVFRLLEPRLVSLRVVLRVHGRVTRVVPPEAHPRCGRHAAAGLPPLVRVPVAERADECLSDRHAGVFRAGESVVDVTHEPLDRGVGCRKETWRFVTPSVRRKRGGGLRSDRSGSGAVENRLASDRAG